MEEGVVVARATDPLDSGFKGLARTEPSITLANRASLQRENKTQTETKTNKEAFYSRPPMRPVPRQRSLSGDDDLHEE